MMESFFFAFVGAMMYIGSIRYEMSYDKEAKWWKWCFVPFGLALLFGIQRMLFLQDYVYMLTVNSKKQLYGHYLALLIPLICVIGIFLYRFLKQRNVGKRVY